MKRHGVMYVGGNNAGNADTRAGARKRVQRKSDAVCRPALSIYFQKESKEPAETIST